MLVRPKSVFEIADENERRFGGENSDYDYRIGTLDAYSKGEPVSNYFGHWTDAGKKPDHPTFSKESWFSQFGNKKGGEWKQSEDGSWEFYPQEWQVKDIDRMNKLMKYFENERGKGIDRIVLPNGRIIQ